MGAPLDDAALMERAEYFARHGTPAVRPVLAALLAALRRERAEVARLVEDEAGWRQDAITAHGQLDHLRLLCGNAAARLREAGRAIDDHDASLLVMLTAQDLDDAARAALAGTGEGE